MKKIILIIIFLFISPHSYTENYLISGGQTSIIKYQISQHVEPSAGTKIIKMSFVIPESFSSPTYNQTIENLNINMDPEPDIKKYKHDIRGNRILNVEWKELEKPINIIMDFTAKTRTTLQTIKSSTKFPFKVSDEHINAYLASTGVVQSDNELIKKKTSELIQGVETEFDAVQRILSWVIDNMHYVTPPKKYDALYSFNTGRGNCQNYSHLSAALMRAAGIPVRIVNGVTLKKAFTVNIGSENYRFKMGQGRHSWIEVYFPDLGWIPFDPQQTELFVSNRFIRIEVGIDNEETVNDGLVRWYQKKGVKGKPTFQESIEADFLSDNIELSCKKMDYGPRKMLLCPRVDASFQPVFVPPSPVPVKIPEKKLKQLKYLKPFIAGNLDFPRKINFAFNTTTPEKKSGTEFIMKKNFLVETAEYVTTKLTQYAQVFILQKPAKILKSSLALHKFGGSGQLWLELREDDNGRPGRMIAASDFISLDRLPSGPGYDWVEFNYSDTKLALQPGAYWLSLGFTGSPIVNWFYTYGKSIGPVDGTRYKSVYDEKWKGALAYEFNYKIEGLTAE